jgi:phage recombination protein Bet
MSNTAIATVTEAPRRSLLAEMASRYGMEPKTFADTLRATVVPKDTSNEEFAAFLVVAREYDLNPLTKEIYAFPKRGGGIVPIVPIDGWTNIINSHPALDGIEFDDHLDDKQKLTAITCRIWRKDRAKPIVVTEYMTECARDTDTWKKWPRRMLRHKALIQCARYAFGFAGIVDPDEAERMGADVTKMRNVSGDGPPPPPSAKQITAQSAPLAPAMDPAMGADADLALVEGGRDDGSEMLWDESDPSPRGDAAGLAAPSNSPPTRSGAAKAAQNTAADLIAEINALESKLGCLQWEQNNRALLEGLSKKDRAEIDTAFARAHESAED